MNQKFSLNRKKVTWIDYYYWLEDEIYQIDDFGNCVIVTLSHVEKALLFINRL